MPIYEYKCNSCKHEFEQLKGIKEITEHHACLKCNHKATQQISGGVGVNGFYEEEGWEDDVPMDV